MNLAPILSAATPADDSSAVAVGSNIVLTFNEDLAFGSGTITISDGYTQTYLDKSGALQTRWVGATDTRVLSISDPQLSIAGNVVTIDLSQDLKAGLTYNLTMSKGFFQDSEQLPVAGILGSGKLNFTTAGGVTAPTAHIGAAIQFDDTGVSNSDYITHSAAVQGSYSGTLGAHDLVQVSLDNGASWNIASAANGSWSYSGTPGEDGASTVIARVANTIGQSSGSTSHAYTFDSTAPTVASATISSATLSAPATVTVTFSEPVSNFDIASQSTDSSSYGSFASTDGGTTWSATVTPNANTQALHVQDSFVINFSDQAGNAQSNYQFSVPEYTVDNAAPQPTLTLSALSNDSGSSSSDFITNDIVQTLSGTLSGALAVGSIVGVREDEQQEFGHVATVDNVHHTWSLDTSLGWGSHTLTVYIVDAFGNETDLISQNYTTDSEGPAVLSASLDKTILGAGDTATITVTMSEAVSSFTIINQTVNSSTYGTFSSSDGLHWSATVTPNANTDLAAVHDALVISATDIAGNQASGSVDVQSYQIATILDLPNVAISAFSADTGDSSSDFVTASAAQTLSGTLSHTLPNGDTVQVSVDDGAHWSSATVNDLSWSASGITLVEGHHSMLARVSDGSTFGGTFEGSYTLDTQAPALQSSTLDGNTIVLSFDEDVSVDTHTFFTLSDGSGNSMQIGVENSLVSVNGHDVTLTLPAALSSNTSYSLDLAGGSLGDLAGNVAYANSDHLLDLATDGDGHLQMAAHIIAGATSSFDATSTSISGQFYSVSGNDHVQVYDGSQWNTVSEASVDGNLHSWSASIGLLSSVVQARLVDGSGNPVPYLSDGASTLYFGASDALAITATGSHSIVFGGNNDSSITTVLTVGDHAHVTSGTGQNAIVAGDDADIVSNGRDSIVAGSHANVVMNGASGSTLASAGSYLNLSTNDGSHSIVLSGLDPNSSIAANGSNDTLNFNFSAAPTSLNELVNTYHMSGVEILNVMLSGNDISIGSPADVAAFAGGQTLHIAGDPGTTIEIDPSQWEASGSAGGYTLFSGLSDPNIQLYVWSAMGGLTQ